MMVNSWAEAYRGRRVLVTGHTGFKGSWLATWLSEIGAKVIGLSLPPDTTPNLFSAAKVGEHIESRLGDIRDAGLVAAVVKDAAPEIVFHLAAQPLVRRSYADPIETFATNVLGTAHMLEACRKTDTVKSIVVVTTDKVYRNNEWPWPYREADRLGGADPYSASKACAELVTEVYRDNLCPSAGGALVATARGGNVVGGGDWSADRLIPDIVRWQAAGREIVLRNPAAVRPWQHVLELCDGYLELGARLWKGQRAAVGAWNFGPAAGSRLTVLDLTRLFLAVMGKPDYPVRVERMNDGAKESQLLRLDISKAVSELAWRPRLSARDTLAWTASWYNDHAARPGDARKLMLGQIAAFEAKRSDAGAPA